MNLKLLWKSPLSVAGIILLLVCLIMWLFVNRSGMDTATATGKNPFGVLIIPFLLVGLGLIVAGWIHVWWQDRQR